MDKKFEPAGADAAVEAEMDSQVPAIRPEFGIASKKEFTGNMSLPYLGIAHGVGGLSEAGFAPGSLVLGKEHLIAAKGEPVKIIIASFEEYYKEYLSSAEWTAGKRPQVFRTKEEAHAAGLSTEYNQATGQMPQAPMAMIWSILIEKPQDIVCPYFCIEASGKVYAPAYFPVEKGAFASVKNAFGMAVRFTTKARGLHTAVWELTTALHTAKTGNKSWVPKIAQVGSLTVDEETAIKAAMVA